MNKQSPTTPSNPRSLSQSAALPISRLIIMGIGVRLFIDTGIQLFGPYLPAIAGGLGVSVVTLGALNSMRSLTGLAAPIMGAVADRYGYRVVMRGLLLTAAAGTFLFAASHNFGLALVGAFFMGLGLFGFTPVLQAYMSAQIPYERRSRGLGVVEYAWAFASIIGVSSAGLMIERLGWRAPFWVLGAGLLLAFFVFGALPATKRRRESGSARQLWQWRRWPARLLDLARLESNARSTHAAILANGLAVFATSNVTLVYGVWLSNEYGLTPSRLGLVALALGLSELLGSVLVSLFGDRFGKYRSILLGAAASVFTYALLPFLNVSVLAIVPGLLLMRFLFEVTLVSNISLLSEQVPTQRGKVLTLATAGVTTGLALASFTGPAVYESWGISGVGILSTTSALLATLLFWRRVSERSAPA